MRRLHCPYMSRNLQPDDRLGDYTADARIITLSVMAAAVGMISAFVALALVRLIGLFTNLAYFHRFDTSLVSPAASGPGLWSLPIPVVGGLIVGLLDGTDRRRSGATAFRKRWRQSSSAA